MTALVLTVLVASVTGSLHCAGMCGPLLAWSAAGGKRPFAAHACYHGGRLAAYAVLGALAGALGAALDLGGALVGIRRFALVAAGAGLIAFGLLNLSGRSWLDDLPLVRSAGSLYRRAAAPLRRLAPPARAGAIGALSGLLPCGWLYAFVMTAAGTGSAWRGALVMAVFWSGTLPLLGALGLGLHAARPLARFAPRLAAAALVIVGLFAIASRGGATVGAGAADHCATQAIAGTPAGHAAAGEAGPRR